LLAWSPVVVSSTILGAVYCRTGLSLGRSSNQRVHSSTKCVEDLDSCQPATPSVLVTTAFSTLHPQVFSSAINSFPSTHLPPTTSSSQQQQHTTTSLPQREPCLLSAQPTKRVGKAITEPRQAHQGVYRQGIETASRAPLPFPSFQLLLGPKRRQAKATLRSHFPSAPGLSRPAAFSRGVTTEGHITANLKSRPEQQSASFRLTRGEQNRLAATCGSVELQRLRRECFPRVYFYCFS
jgi:hypothetical protein